MAYVHDLWRVTIRTFDVTGVNKQPFFSTWHIAVPPEENNEKKVAQLARDRFTVSWWEEHTITDLTLIRKTARLRRGGSL